MSPLAPSTMPVVGVLGSLGASATLDVATPDLDVRADRARVGAGLRRSAAGVQRMPACCALSSGLLQLTR